MTPSKVTAYVERVLSKLRSLSATRDGWLARCPNPAHSGGTGDQSPSLRVTVGEAGRVILHCRAGCDTADVLKGAGLRWADLFCPKGCAPQEALTQEPDEPGPDALALRSEVYEAFLGMLTLTKEHRKHLEGRGLGKAAITTAHYASFDPLAAHAPGMAPWQRLFKEHGDSLFRVPGFLPEGYAVRLGGILVPIRDHEGAIEALKIRTLGPMTDSGEAPRYLSFSGGGGQSCGARVHHPINNPVETDRVVVTEGELKADVANALSGEAYLSVPGVANFARAVPVIALMGDVVKVDVAFDWPDVKAKAPVRRCLLGLLRDLRAAGYVPGVLTWHEKYKGVDDALHAGAEVTRHAGEGLQALEAALRLGAVATAPSLSERKWPLSASAWFPPPFPTASLPPEAANAVRAVAASKQCPEDFAAVGVLAASASAVGATRAIEVKPGWRELPCLYTGVVAPPGSRKTPALRAVLSPVYDRQTELSRRHEAGECELLDHVWVQDCTVEGVTQVLKHQPRGVLLVQDELVAWVLGDNKYRAGKGADRQFWLSAWSSEPIKADRKVSGSTHIRSPFLCALGGIQPDMLPALMDAKGREDGFVHRLLFAYPEAGAPILWGDATNGHSYDSRGWRSLIESLYGLDFDVSSGPYPEPRVLRFDAGAARAWASFYDEHVLEACSPGFPRRMEGPWSKLISYAARFSLLLCLLRSASPGHEREVTAEDVEGAKSLVAYFASMAHGVQLSMRRCEHDDSLPRLVASASSGAVTARALMRREGMTRTQALALMRRAEDLGLGEVRPGRSVDGRARDEFVLVANEGEDA